MQLQRQWLHTCLVARPAFRTRLIIVWTTLTFWFWSLRIMLAHTHRVGITVFLFCFDGGRILLRIFASSGVFSCNSCHTLFHVKFSNAGLDVIRRIESWVSEHTLLISFWISLHSNEITSLLKLVFCNTAVAIDCLFPLPTYFPIFFRDPDRWKYLFLSVFWKPQPIASMLTLHLNRSTRRSYRNIWWSLLRTLW